MGSPATEKGRVGNEIQHAVTLSKPYFICKYPVTQAEYYRLYAVFNQTADDDQPDKRPTMPLPTPQQRAEFDQMLSRFYMISNLTDDGLPRPEWRASLEGVLAS